MQYRAHYRDKNHDCSIVIENKRMEGNYYELSFHLDGFRFIGWDLCDFELEDPDVYENANKRFNLLKLGGYPGYEGKIVPYTYSLQRYALSVEIPVKAVNRQTMGECDGTIIMEFESREHDIDTNQSIFRCDEKRVFIDDTFCNRFSLLVQGRAYDADRPTTCFEQALLQICEKCREEYLLKCCFTCQYSDYSPYGSDDFGTMLCYKRHKEVYLTVNDKNGYFDKLEGLDFNTQQETNLCDEFEERLRCEGYRGKVEKKYIVIDKTIH